MKTICTSNLLICPKAFVLSNALRPQCTRDMPENLNQSLALIVKCYVANDRYYAVDRVYMLRTFTETRVSMKVKVHIIEENSREHIDATLLSEVFFPVLYVGSAGYVKITYKRLNALRMNDVEMFNYFFENISSAKELRGLFRLTANQSRSSRAIKSDLTIAVSELKL